MKRSLLDDGKGSARGLDEISSVFLSSSRTGYRAESEPSRALPHSGAPLLFAVLCSLSGPPAIESFFACSLCLEIARNNRTATLIDLGFERSIAWRLMRCAHPGLDLFKTAETVRLDYKLQAMTFTGLREITFVRPALPKGRKLHAGVVERVLAEEKVGKCDLILVNSPMGSDEVSTSGIFRSFRKAVLFMDNLPISLARAYAWIKIYSGCRCWLIGAVCGTGEQTEVMLRNVSRLQKAVFKHLPVGIELRVVPVPLTGSAWTSMQTAGPNTGPSPPSSSAVARLCENLLRDG